MEKKNHSIDWRSKFQKNFDLYGGRLSRLYSLSNVDVGVYLFLLMRKWYTKEFQLSKNGITNELNSLPSHFVPPEFQVKYDPRKVEASLIRLVSYGFIKKCKNKKIKKLGHRNPDFIYETKDITELQSESEQSLQQAIKDRLGLFDELGNIEEDAMSFKSQLEERNNGTE